MTKTAIPLLPLLLMSACQSGGSAGLPGDGSDTRPFAGIAANQTVHFTGTEPFWGGTVTGATLTYSTPENSGTGISVQRFAGRGGLSFSGTLGGKALDMMVTEGACNDGMSDRGYPFTVTLRLGTETRNGCGWTQARPFTGPKNP
ncbi:MAG TPA: hypothetical protein VJM34_04315 [Novosphingobium sp.]|nr:hypothetical protein [Novosphingobium sp.]